MNLFYEEFPKAVIVSGIEVPIVTDLREYIKMLDMLKDPDVSNEEKTYFLADYFTDKIPDFNEAVKQLSDFVLMKSFATTGIDVEIEEKEETREEKHLFSFEIDYPYILSFLPFFSHFCLTCLCNAGYGQIIWNTAFCINSCFPPVF